MATQCRMIAQGLQPSAVKDIGKIHTAIAVQKVQQYAFLCTSPSVWNAMPENMDLHAMINPAEFRKQLKVLFLR